MRTQLHAEVSEIIAILPRGGPSNKVVIRGVDLLQRVLRDAEADTPPPVEALWPGVAEWESWGEQERGAPQADLWTNTVRSFEGEQDPFWMGDRWWTA